MLKKATTTLLCICMIFSLILIPSNASQVSTGLSVIDDTTRYTEAQYLNPIQFEKNSLTRISQTRTIELTCESFLAMAKASVRNPDQYDLSKKIMPNHLIKDTIQYRLSEYAYQAELIKALNQTISSDLLEFTDFTVDIIDKKAVASVVESYTYYINDGFDDESFRRKMYTFELEYINSQWLITSVITNDPWECEAGFVYQSIDVKSAINEIIAAKKVSENDKFILQQQEEMQHEMSAGYFDWTYNTSKAVSYAVAHYKDTSNSVFGFTPGNNCQNFSSQCVWAGLGGTGTSNSSLPAVTTARAGANAPNVWCRNQNISYYDEFYFNWPWDNVRGFMKMLRGSSTSREGPYGNAYYTNAIKNAEVGNVLSINWDGTADEHSMAHAMFVTQVSGTAGSRTKADVKIADHTSATNSAYQTVSSYASNYSDTNFGRSVILKGFYLVEQP